MGNETNLVAACPKCRARYRIEAGRVAPEGVRLRCQQCDAVFRVTPPAAPATAVAVPVPEAAPVAEPPLAFEPPASDVAPVEPPSAPESSTSEGRGALVVIADSDIEAGKQTVQALTDWGYTPVLVHDGVEAILTIQRQLPSAVVLDAGLTKMFGFQVCELMKRNESLSSIQVALVGSVHHETRYRREPNELYGADAYVERPQLPEALRAILRGFGLTGEPAGPTPIEVPPSTEPEPAAAEPPFVPVPVPTPETGSDSERDASDFGEGSGETSAWQFAGPTPGDASDDPPPVVDPPDFDFGGVDSPTAEAPAFDEPELIEDFAVPDPVPAPAIEPAPEAAPALADVGGEEIAAAQRLARIIVSDIVLYNAERFESGVRSGDVVGALSAELQEGRTLLAQRVSARVRDSCDFLAEELVRVAKARGMDS